MEEFNSIEPIGSIYVNQFRKQKPRSSKLRSSVPKLVEIICYCANPNHYHFVVKQLAERGIEKFMHRLGCGYTNYFNKKYHRSGVLFQGAFKAIHITSDPYLLHVSAYVNLNNKVHKITKGFWHSSWSEYIGSKKDGLCEKELILNQFKDSLSYKEFAENALQAILERKQIYKDIEVGKFENEGAWRVT
jgi:putative transposase